MNKCILDIEKLKEFQTILRVSKITVSWSNELQSKKTLMKYCSGRELVGGRDITSCSYSDKKNIWCDVQCRGARKLLPKRLLVFNKACRIRASKLSSGDAAAAECPDEGELFSRCACRVPLLPMFVVLPPLVAHFTPSIQTSARDWLLFRSRTL